MLSVFQNRKTVVPSGHGTGKTYISAKIAIVWLLLYPHSKVITTAPKWEQVKDLLWGELRKSVKTSVFPIGGILTEMELFIDEDWYAKGLSSRYDSDEGEYGATRMQGYHSPHLLIITDESPGIHPSIIKALESLATGEHNHHLAIGNPIGQQGHFWEWERSESWHKIRLSCLDHPNIIQQKEIIPGAVTQGFINDYKNTYGEHSPIYQAKILGVAVDSSESILIPRRWFEDAAVRKLEAVGRKSLGIDVARSLEGDDTVFFGLHGHTQKHKEVVKYNDIMKVVGRAVQIHNDDDYNVIIVDDTGVGGGVSDRLKELLPEVLIIKHVGSEKSYKYDKMGHKKYFNKRAEVLWEVREEIKKLQIDYDNELVTQGSSLRWFPANSNGSIQIESKDDYKKRNGGKSPDILDALSLAVHGLCSEQTMVQSTSRYEANIIVKKNLTPQERHQAMKERNKLLKQNAENLA